MFVDNCFFFLVFFFFGEHFISVLFFCRFFFATFSHTGEVRGHSGGPRAFLVPTHGPVVCRAPHRHALRGWVPVNAERFLFGVAPIGSRQTWTDLDSFS